MTTAPDLWRRFPIEPDTEDLACMPTSNVLAPLPARQNAVKKNARQHVAGGLIEVLILDSLARQRTDLGTEIGIICVVAQIAKMRCLGSTGLIRPSRIQDSIMRDFTSTR
jgi:hypothetical protein